MTAQPGELHLKIDGEHRLHHSRQEVWEALLDPEILANTLPGCKNLELVGEHRYQGKLDISVGPVKGQFQGSVELSDLSPPSSYRFKLDGRGAPGFVNGEGVVELEEDNGHTRLRYQIDARIGGRIAGVGQRLLDSSARVITRQGLEGLEQQLAARYGAGTGAAAPAQTAARSPTVFAARFAKDLLGELIPPERRPIFIGVGLLALAIVIFVLVRACTV